MSLSRSVIVSEVGGGSMRLKTFEGRGYCGGFEIFFLWPWTAARLTIPLLARAALFLTGDDASYATGAELLVDGSLSPIWRHGDARPAGRLLASSRGSQGTILTGIVAIPAGTGL
jgi:hypothetical protein